jgi:hypothetical protein
MLGQLLAVATRLSKKVYSSCMILRSGTLARADAGDGIGSVDRGMNSVACRSDEPTRHEAVLRHGEELLRLHQILASLNACDRLCSRRPCHRRLIVLQVQQRWAADDQEIALDLTPQRSATAEQPRNLHLTDLEDLDAVTRDATGTGANRLNSDGPVVVSVDLWRPNDQQVDVAVRACLVPSERAVRADTSRGWLQLGDRFCEPLDELRRQAAQRSKWLGCHMVRHQRVEDRRRRRSTLNHPKIDQSLEHSRCLCRAHTA